MWFSSRCKTDMPKRQRLLGSVITLLLGASGVFFSPSSDAQDGAVSSGVAVPGGAKPPWVLRLPAEPKVGFAGQLNLDGAGMAGAPMLYPVPNAAGLLVAVLAHGLIAESAKNEQKARLQRSANSILDPYQETLSAFTHQELAQLTLARPLQVDLKNRTDAAEPVGSAVVIESSPQFFFTQDLSAIILENEVVISKADGSLPGGHRSVVRVVSRATLSESITPFWLADAGKNVKQKCAALLAESLDIALTQFAQRGQKNEAPHRTFRYMEGTVEKVERGQFLSTRCNRTVLTSLRGTLISFPSPSQDASPAAGGTNLCGATLAAAAP